MRLMFCLMAFGLGVAAPVMAQDVTPTLAKSDLGEFGGFCGSY
jgi:hypothetical protein